ncbi:MAG TPA: hypothetical protein VHY20_02590, partial [Pirellulales bacterium]|nr:hypothetical protein [Pirellulales bacterium]
MAKKHVKKPSKPAAESVPAEQPDADLADASPADAELNELAEPADEERSASPTIVGIGASAGGLQAFSKVLQEMRPDTGLILV